MRLVQSISRRNLWELIETRKRERERGREKEMTNTQIERSNEMSFNLCVHCCWDIRGRSAILIIGWWEKNDQIPSSWPTQKCIVSPPADCRMAFRHRLSNSLWIHRQWAPLWAPTKANALLARNYIRFWMFHSYLSNASQRANTARFQTVEPPQAHSLPHAQEHKLIRWDTNSKTEVLPIRAIGKRARRMLMYRGSESTTPNLYEESVNVEKATQLEEENMHMLN